MADQANDTGSRMADAQAAAPPNLSKLEQKLLSGFHGAEDHVKRAVRTLLNANLVESEDQAQTSTRGKRKHVLEEDEENWAKRARTSITPSGAEAIDFRSIKNPDPIHCIIQVNGGPPQGSLDTRDAGYSIRVILDGGIGRSPSIALRFRHPGSEGDDVGRVRWHLDSRAEDRWVIQNFEYLLVSEVPHDTAINHTTVINQCEGRQSLERLMCITLRLTPHGGGTCKRPASDASQAIKACTNAIFWKRKDYNLRIWFLKPWANISDLETNCLSVMRFLFGRRQEPLSRAQDINGLYFADSTTEARHGISPVMARHHGDPGDVSLPRIRPVVPVMANAPSIGGNVPRAWAGTAPSSRAYQEAAINPSDRAPPIEARRTNPAATLSLVMQPLSDDEDGEIKEEEEDTASSDKAADKSNAQEEAEDYAPAGPARDLLSGISEAINEAAKARRGR